ncbi:MAG: hypothetical protein ACLR17_02280 [Enterobacteriaceae bacterium]
MDNSLFFARQINDAFIVVSTNSYPNIAVNYENRKVGVTDKNGHLLIPWATAWYPGKSPSIRYRCQRTPKPSRWRNASPCAKAAEHWSISGTACARQPSSSSMPGGNRCRSVRRSRRLTASSGLVGYDGVVWFSHLGRHNEVKINAGELRCSVQFELPSSTPVPQRIGPVSCPS